LTCQIHIARLAGQVVVSGGHITLRLQGNSIGSMDRRGRDHNTRRKARDCTPWADTQITGDNGRAGIGYRRTPQDSEARRHTQPWRGGKQGARPGVPRRGEKQRDQDK